MIDNVSLQIEESAYKNKSYIIAIIEFCEQNGIHDYEDLTEVLDKSIIPKIKQEFIDKGFIPKLKKDNNILDFF
jgi:hypothetical protein